MQPNSEPTQSDVNAVAQAMNIPAPQPAPQAAPQEPAQMQPTEPTPQAAPTQQPTQEPADPFANLFQEPQQPAQPTQQEPQQPAPAVEPAQNQEPAPAPQPAPQEAPNNDQPQSYQEYIDSVLKNVPKAPDQPDPDKVDGNDPAAVKQFFDDLMNTAVARAGAEAAQKQALQQSEKKLWDDAMNTYGTLRSNKELRDMVHNIRVANFQRGVAMTPTQAAQKLVTALRGQYNKGIADNQVVTTIEQVQPQGGQSGQQMPTSLDTQNALQAVQTGGETALVAILDQEIKAGRF